MKKKIDLDEAFEYCYGSYLAFKDVIEKEGKTMDFEKSAIFYGGVASGMVAMGMPFEDAHKLCKKASLLIDQENG